MGRHGDPGRRVAPDDRAREGAARRLMVVRLRVEIAKREQAQPTDPRIGEARQELRALTRSRPSTPAPVPVEPKSCSNAPGSTLRGAEER